MENDAFASVINVQLKSSQVSDVPKHTYNITKIR